MGMTLKQADKARFKQLATEYNELKKNMTEKNKRRFVLLSVQLHAVKGRVPKRMHSLINK